METDKRIKLIYWANNLFFLAGILISFRLWLSHRAFPLVPFQEILPKFNTPFDFIVLLCLIILLAGSLFYFGRPINYSILFLFIVLMLQDQMRWQPWAFHFFLFLIPFCLFEPKEQSNPLGYFQIVIIGIYLWSGLHKLNAEFILNVFPKFAEGITGSIPQAHLKLGYAIPLVEILIAIGLFFRKTRNGAVGLGIITHLSILIWLTPAGGNTNIVILPWNLAMITFLGLCFFRVKGPYPYINWQGGPFEYLKIIILLPVFILPAFNIWGLWDYYLSFNLYSGKNKFLYVAIEESELKKLPYNFKNMFLEIPGLEGGKIIDINKWSLQELKVPIPPEDRIFKGVTNFFCKLGIPEDRIMVLEFEQPIAKGIYRNYPCNKED